jgi:GTP cyclohydrolase I
MPRIKTDDELPDISYTLDSLPKRYVPTVGFQNIEIPVNSGVVSTYRIGFLTDMTPKTKGANIGKVKSLIENKFSLSTKRLIDNVDSILDYAKDSLDAGNAEISVKTQKFVDKKSPVDKISSFVAYDYTIIGKLVSGTKKFFIEIKTPYISLCPRSKEISDYGAHSQISYATIIVEVADIQSADYDQRILKIVDGAASAPIYNNLSCVDESYITEQMYENPVFPEDVTRKIAVELDNDLDKSITDYKISVEHHESIHTSFAVSVLTARNL